MMNGLVESPDLRPLLLDDIEQGLDDVIPPGVGKENAIFLVSYVILTFRAGNASVGCIFSFVVDLGDGRSGGFRSGGDIRGGKGSGRNFWNGHIRSGDIRSGSGGGGSYSLTDGDRFHALFVVGGAKERRRSEPHHLEVGGAVLSREFEAVANHSAHLGCHPTNWAVLEARVRDLALRLAYLRY